MCTELVRTGGRPKLTGHSARVYTHIQVTEIDENEDWLKGVWTHEHTYTTPNNNGVCMCMCVCVCM